MSTSYYSGEVGGYPFRGSEGTYGRGPRTYTYGSINGIPYNYSTQTTGSIYDRIGSISQVYDAITGAVIDSVVSDVLSNPNSQPADATLPLAESRQERDLPTILAGSLQQSTRNQDDVFSIDKYGVRYELRGNFDLNDKITFIGDYSGVAPGDVKVYSIIGKSRKSARAKVRQVTQAANESIVAISYYNNNVSPGYDAAIYFNANGSDQGYGSNGGLIAVVYNDIIVKDSFLYV